MARQRAVTKGRLKVHDPFELVRWLALSQSDPRRALAELVQNSLDAGAGQIRVTRQRVKGKVCLRIWDDGEGVIPELDRPEALRYIATHIGHSRKRDLTPQERLRLMTQGQYGIGLLGFWSLGEALELRSSLPGHRAHRLILHRDRPDYVIEPLRGRLPFDERWTEVVIVDLHRRAPSTRPGARSLRRSATSGASATRSPTEPRQVTAVESSSTVTSPAPTTTDPPSSRLTKRRSSGAASAVPRRPSAVRTRLVGRSSGGGAAGVSSRAALSAAPGVPVSRITPPSPRSPIFTRPRPANPT
jgi:hypothetical protein